MKLRSLAQALFAVPSSWYAVAVWLIGILAILSYPSSSIVVVTHWANGHMMERDALLPGLARRFNESNFETRDGREIKVKLYMANSGEISGELKARLKFSDPVDRAKPNPVVVTPAADHWVNDVNQSLGGKILDVEGADRIAMTYIGIVTSREMAICLGWPEREIGFADIVALVTSSTGWSNYACARPEWGREAQIAFTYPSRSSTARSVLFSLYAVAARKPADQLTLVDIDRPDVQDYVKRFQNSIDCYVPDTLDLNTRIVAKPACAQFFFLAEDNLVQLYQGKVVIPNGDRNATAHLDKDMVMIYPKEGAILHNHSALLVNAPFVNAQTVEAAKLWISFLRQDEQQRALMQEGFRPTTSLACIDPIGSPFSQCATTPKTLIYPDRIDPEVAQAILRRWE